ncbi:hypothetical protein SpCBS45565_g01981 [Spizellomyces sp. 'palustris']|nr:hypothetical protein SpCBS45565_g01981 [Spizellomyces sp. 'palustris']
MKKAVLSNIVPSKGSSARQQLLGSTDTGGQPSETASTSRHGGETLTGNQSLASTGPGGDKAAVPSTLQRPVRFRLTGALSALSASPEQDWVAVAGREVLKILSVYDKDVKEVLNLRGGVKLNLNFSINDVKWGNIFAKSTIATAATNGAVAIWDLNRPNAQKLERILTEHTRAVNRINFHPTEPVLLLSASQDGTMRLWDLRAKSIARNAFEGKAESVRDVQFSPTNAFEFVAAFENGTIQKWDIRYPTQYERKWSAHNGLALTVDWHPEGRWVASGGRDRQIKIWDMKSDSRKPLYAIQTIAPVSRVNWRPGHESQLACCALSTDFRIHTWDVGRPYIAQHSIEAHDGVITGFLWRDANSIWSCSKDRTFARHDIRTGYKPLSLLNTCAMNWNVNGDITFAIDERRQDTAMEDSRSMPTGSYYPLRRAFRRPMVPERSTSDDKIPQYRPRQKVGVVDTETFDDYAFVVLAQDYAIQSDDIWSSCQHNAEVAIDLELHRTAQTWKILQLLYGTEPSESRNLTKLFGRPNKQGDYNWDRQAGNTPVGRAADECVDPQLTVGSAQSDSALLTEMMRPNAEGWMRDYVVPHGSQRRGSLSPHHDQQELAPESDIDSDEGYTEEEEVDDDGDSDDSESSFTYGLKVGAGRRTLARFGIGTNKILKPFYGGKSKQNQPHSKRDSSKGKSKHSQRTVNSAKVVYQDVVIPDWNPEDLVRDMLEYYAEQANVQMCATILLVLKDRIRAGEEKEELWFCSYIGLNFGQPLQQLFERVQWPPNPQHSTQYVAIVRSLCRTYTLQIGLVRIVGNCKILAPFAIKRQKGCIYGVKGVHMVDT